MRGQPADTISVTPDLKMCSDQGDKKYRAMQSDNACAMLCSVSNDGRGDNPPYHAYDHSLRRLKKARTLI